MEAESLNSMPMGWHVSKAVNRLSACTVWHSQTAWFGGVPGAQGSQTLIPMVFRPGVGLQASWTARDIEHSRGVFGLPATEA